MMPRNMKNPIKKKAKIKSNKPRAKNTRTSNKGTTQRNVTLTRENIEFLKAIGEKSQKIKKARNSQTTNVKKSTTKDLRPRA